MKSTSLKLIPLIDIALVLTAAALLLIAASGGIDLVWGGFAIRLHAVLRPLLLLMVIAAGRFALSRFDISYVSTRGLAALLLAAAATYATYQVRVCGGLDSYGYVSASSLITSGHLIQPQPLVKYLSFDRASDAAAPLGYIAGRDGRTEVPRFPLGLPAVMAVFRMFGPTGPFLVPLVMGLVGLAAAFLIARDLPPAAPTPVALLAAALVAVDPLFADYAMQPMSDVPAACWLLLAVWLMLAKSGRTGRSLLAGLCAGMAVITRPAFLPAAAAVGMVSFDRPRREIAQYVAGLAVFVVAQMAINAHLYGSISESGYGPASYMFEISSLRLRANLANYGKWLTHSHSWLIWIIWPASLVLLWRERWAWKVSAVAAAAAAPYLFYLVFDDWESGRFLLPAILLILILAARAIGVLLKNTQVAAVGALVVAVAGGAASNRFLRDEGAYRFRDLESKYPLAGEWIAAHTPENAVVFAALHSGSIRYYGHRQTIRWDQIPADNMLPALHNLEAAGYATYLALDSSAAEPMLFQERFGGRAGIRIEPIDRVRVVTFFRITSQP